MNTTDQTSDNYDLIIAGSGAAGLSAAISAARSGLKVIVLEKESLWGGVTCYSGGVLWTPAHHLMLADGGQDSEEQALTYMERVIGDAGPASSPARRSTFVRNAARIIKLLEEEGMEWSYQRGFHDYYSEETGASDCRGVGAKVFDGKKLGPWLATMRRSAAYPPVAVAADEMIPILTPLTHPWTMARVVLRTLWWRLCQRLPLTVGQSLAGQLMLVAQRHGVDVKLNTAVKDLIVEDGKVVGVVVQHNGQANRLRARAGVMLCAGGFAQNGAFRRRYQKIGAEYSAAVNPGDSGDLIQLGMAHSAATALMEAAWGMPTVVLPDGEARMLLWERCLPHSIIVDSAGKRYMNEAQSYNDVGRLMLEHGAPETPSWIIMDARHRRRYPFLTFPGGMTPRKMIDAGFFIKANSLSELAQKCGIDAANLQLTVARFNAQAVTGIDHEFGRGNTKFDRVWGDAKVKPNPNLGAIEQAPFWAVRVYPGDLGTKGGLLTDENARVLREDGSAIEGLYASGNTSASVMGRSYPGPGSTLGPATVFGWLAAEYAAKIKEE